jgi:Rod binding domain-containing protein
MNGIGAVNFGMDAAPLPLPRAAAMMQGAEDREGEGVRSPAFRNELRKSAEQLVASALLMPVLEEMSNSPLRPEDGPFAENIVEKRFGPLLHQHLADRMMQSRSFGLVDAVIARLSPASNGADMAHTQAARGIKAASAPLADRAYTLETSG